MWPSWRVKQLCFSTVGDVFSRMLGEGERCGGFGLVSMRICVFAFAGAPNVAQSAAPALQDCIRARYEGGVSVSPSAYK